jgi:hypothetical protein
MSYKAVAVFDKVTLPTVADGDTSRPFSVPSGAKSLTVFIPSVAGTPTFKVQALVPPDGDQDTEVWLDLSYMPLDAAGGAPTALDGLPESTAIALPVSAFGGGVFRFVASATLTSTPADSVTIRVAYTVDSVG